MRGNKAKTKIEETGAKVGDAGKTVVKAGKKTADFGIWAWLQSGAVNIDVLRSVGGKITFFAGLLSLVPILLHELTGGSWFLSGVFEKATDTFLIWVSIILSLVIIVLAVIVMNARKGGRITGLLIILCAITKILVGGGGFFIGIFMSLAVIGGVLITIVARTEEPDQVSD